MDEKPQPPTTAEVERFLDEVLCKPSSDRNAIQKRIMDEYGRERIARLVVNYVDSRLRDRIHVELKLSNGVHVIRNSPESKTSK